MVFQKPTPFPMSIYDNIAFGVRLYEKLRIGGRRPRRGGCGRRLSGTRSRTSCASRAWASRAASSSACASPTIAQRPEVILLDEPTSALDPISTGKIETDRAAPAEFTIVIVTHNMQQAARISQFTAFMYLGELVEFGDHRGSS